MPEPLASEELHELSSQIPNFMESPKLRSFAERKLLPQQNDITSFENPDFVTMLRRKTYGFTRQEKQLLKRQQEYLPQFQQEQEIRTKLQVMQQFALENAPTYPEAQARGVDFGSPAQNVLQPGPTGGMPPSNIQSGQPGANVSVPMGPPATPDVSGSYPMGPDESGWEPKGPIQDLNAVAPLREAPTSASTTMPMQQTNPGTKLSLQDLQLYENAVAGRGVMEHGRYTSMPLAKLPGSMLEASEANAYLKTLGIDTPQPFTQPVLSAMLTEITRQQRSQPVHPVQPGQPIYDPNTKSFITTPGEKPIADNYTNVQPDGQGGFIGLHKKTGRIEQVPMAPGLKGGGQLNPDARTAAAQRYLIDGTLPPNLGRGMQGAANTTAILNEASGIAATQGMGGEAQRIKQLANKSAATALTQLSAQEAKIGAFEKTFTKNMELANTLSTKVHRATGVPIFDAWVQAGQRAVTGDADITALDVAVKSVVNEFARITTSASGSGGNTAEGEIKKIEGLLKTAHTPKQFQAVLSTMRTETQNRIDSFVEQKNQIRRSMGSAGSAPAEPDAPAALPSLSEIEAELARRQRK